VRKVNKTWKEILANGIASAILKAASRRGIEIESSLKGSATLKKSSLLNESTVVFDTTVTHKVKVDHGE